MSPWRSVAYLRDLLMLHGVLPPADRNLVLFAWTCSGGSSPAWSPSCSPASRPS
jgi:hypothetical protein